MAEALLNAGADVAAVDRRGNNALHACAAGAAAADGDEVGLAIARRLLLTASSSVGAANHEGGTPLHMASQHGKRELIELLVERGAPLRQAASRAQSQCAS